MKTFKSGDCGCEIHVIKWSAKANSVTTKLCPLHKAAPELLSALKGLLSPTGGVYGTKEVVEAAKAAIAKATGAEGA